MLLRDLLLVEKNLTPAELIKYDGKYLSILIDLINRGEELEIDPAFKDDLGDTVTIDPSQAKLLQLALVSGDIKETLPKKLEMNVGGDLDFYPLSVLFKSKAFTQAAGQAAYNTGHLAELITGLCVTAKFFNLGEPITFEQVVDMFTYIATKVEGKNYLYSISSTIRYPEMGSKTDTLNFIARIPARSAIEFGIMVYNGKFDSKVHSAIASAIKAVNSYNGVIESCKRVRNDKNNNTIDVVSDGTSNAKGTKADLTLSIDNSKVNLLSLKTSSSDTLGQISGLEYENLHKWFNTSFGLDISPYKKKFDLAQGKDIVFNNLLKFYDEVVYPFVVEKVENQSPGKEAAIVKQFANAANLHARGESNDTVDVIKLSDKVTKGAYKVLRFTDSLSEAMKHLDLTVNYVDKSPGSRTIQIWVKPAEGETVAKGKNKLCQFRTFKTGEYPRNYFETGPILEKLTMVDGDDIALPDKGTVDKKLAKKLGPVASGKLRASSSYSS